MEEIDIKLQIGLIVVGAYIIFVFIRVFYLELRDWFTSSAISEIKQKVKQKSAIKKKWIKALSRLEKAVDADDEQIIDNRPLDLIESRIERLEYELKPLEAKVSQNEMKYFYESALFLFKGIVAAYVNWGQKTSKKFKSKREKMLLLKKERSRDRREGVDSHLSKSELILLNRLTEEHKKTRNTLKKTPSIVFEIKLGLVNLGAKIFGLFFG